LFHFRVFFSLRFFLPYFPFVLFLVLLTGTWI
jgi:hypothetical protein